MPTTRSLHSTFVSAAARAEPPRRLPLSPQPPRRRRGLRPRRRESARDLYRPALLLLLAATLALRLWGPDQLLMTPDMEEHLYAFASGVGGGTDEIQHNIVGERVLGLPREPRP